MLARQKLLLVLAASSFSSSLVAVPACHAQEPVLKVQKARPTVSYHTVQIDGVNVFYREAGPKDAPAVLLLHGFPASSFMFRDLVPQLATRYHVIAPDYPSYGQSDAPDHVKFKYTFDHLASVVEQLTQTLKLEKFTLYVHDYGAPIGYRIASAHPDRITGIVVQNGNAYLEGLPEGFWGGPIKDYWADHSPANRE